jgi:ABC-type uncharacterized transport system involved in gliding motility auxiliary subunit
MNSRIIAGWGLVIALALFLGINIIANQTLTRFRLDVTGNKLHTLSGGTLNILQDLDEPITIRFFYSTKMFAGVPRFANYGNRVRNVLEEYVAASNGMIRVIVIDPEPFSEAEDQAVGFGIEQIPLSATGEKAYLGLVGTNSTDDEIPLAILSPDREQALEYDLTKMVYNLANPKKRIIGLLSGLPVLANAPNPMSNRPTEADWGVIALLREIYEIKQVATDAETIDADIDTLLVIHPKEFGRKTLYAIDQFILAGGRAIIFVDPFAEEDRVAPDPGAQMIIPKMDSNLEPLFEKWGINMVSDKIAVDPDSAVRVTFRAERGPQEVEYLPWLQLQGERLNRDDFVTSELNVIHVGSAGALTHAEDATTEFTPLITTGPNSGRIERDAVFFVRDPNGLIQSFVPEGGPAVLAARVRGVVDTAFPDGRPLDTDEKRAPQDENFLARSDGPINVIIVADTDLLADRFWVRFENFLGMRMPSPFANNADFVINAIDNLGGNDDLISLRSRGEYARPFKVVQNIRRKAEAQFRDEEQALRAKLQETESKIRDLQQHTEQGAGNLLSSEQRNEIELFRKEQLKTRKELRAVQHNLQKNIEKLGSILKFVNIGLIPILISLFAIGFSLVKVRRLKTR